ncbi:unnamed protein product [Linum trigynum]|uniref:Seipin n=1 Tax=Linum trigynum TaxID=586398 RepID=A0AAV2FS74_9ROSI
MESSEKPNHSFPPDDGWFFEAFDDFPFDDCFSCNDQSDQSTSDSTVSEPSTEISSPRTTLRRRPVPGRGFANDDEFKRSDKEEASTIASSVTQRDSKNAISSVEKEKAFYPDLKEIGSDSEIVESSKGTDEVESPSSQNIAAVDGLSEDAKKEEKEEESVLTAMELDNDRGRGAIDSPRGEVFEPPSSNLLELIAGLVIKAAGFQLNLILSFVSFPLWALYCSYMFVTDPFGVTRRGKRFLLQRSLSIWNSTVGCLSSTVNDWLKEHQTKWKLLLGVGWGLVLCVYVCIILCGLLVMAIMVSSLLMKFLVEEPLQIREELNFDFTQSKPVAFVPMVSCPGVGCGVDCKDSKVGEIMSFRQKVIPPKHKVQATVSMTLPESEYNRNLGMFQVRVEFLAADGSVLVSKSHPCMLKFKSEPIRILLTLFKVVPLVAGYISESQTLRLRIRGLAGGDVPTSCLRVMIEQRAEFNPGGGIPELYDASLALESQLPFFRRIIWGWKKTIFVWITLISFVMELLAALICCRPVILPRPRPRNVSTPEVHSSSRNNLPKRR